MEDEEYGLGRRTFVSLLELGLRGIVGHGYGCLGIFPVQLMAKFAVSVRRREGAWEMGIFLCGWWGSWELGDSVQFSLAASSIRWFGGCKEKKGG